ncbi:MAG: hypothetical protein M3433_06000 [Actinomycetota bacterium]|nr:hypothetical protein [Actinomycetota bacterium]
MREFLSGLSRGELALLIVVATALMVWAAVGPSGILAGVLPALALGLLCGAIIGVSRTRSGR